MQIHGEGLWVRVLNVNLWKPKGHWGEIIIMDNCNQVAPISLSRSPKDMWSLISIKNRVLF